LPPSKSSSDGLTRVWQGRGPLAWLLLPLGGLFFLVAALRRLAYRLRWLKSARLPVPVVVVGNIIAGGAGKTPLTLWLAQRLSAAGRKPGIVSRGYGRVGNEIVKVGAGGTAQDYGDEPLLLARRSGCPVYVGADRAAAARALLADHPECNLILCDDGLQHYRLQRDVEIAVVDRRGLMNGWPLPAGPLREPATRLASVDALVLNETTHAPVQNVPTFAMRLAGQRFYRLDTPHLTCAADDLAGLVLHAVAGIGEPQRFFDHLAALGLHCEPHAFPDHHRYTADDLKFGGDALLMTEKDALKCVGISSLPIWVLPVDAVIEPDLARHVLDILEKNPNGPASA
jgi:tetraacyldisaccharide 4'-kinase